MRDDIPPELADYRMIGPEAFAALLDITVPTFRSWYEAGVIPLPVQFSAQRYRWRVSTVRAWLDALEPQGDMALDELLAHHRERLATGNIPCAPGAAGPH